MWQFPLLRPPPKSNAEMIEPEQPLQLQVEVWQHPGPLPAPAQRFSADHLVEASCRLLRQLASAPPP
eukprot:CAMPEP_0178448232 /NCGR_PEP_ID=MMETSP0689_2-20121128/41865_1 /TAXON_ID=160604 /ORGANISM="Amphidinium massartii, Strain CS-259" /LENGTH=66 /DNA_ID=CAMNT_0020073385 /DNA_START=237 /DNA_END=433 /DNA_ORIENTATION=+